jgi:hypothetical protein
MKNNVDYDDISIETIDSGRINQVTSNTARNSISAPFPMVGNKPPSVLEKVGTGDSWHVVPHDFALRRAQRGRLGSDSLDLFYFLGVQMYLPMVAAREAFDLLDDAHFRSVLSIQERRNDGEAQIYACLGTACL